MLTKGFKFFNLAGTPNPFPGRRELIGTVTVNDEPVKVYLPNGYDILDLDANSHEFQYRLAAKSCGMEYGEFMELPASRVTDILELLSNAMTVLK